VHPVAPVAQRTLWFQVESKQVRPIDYFGSDEHEWSFRSDLSGPLHQDPVAAMSARLPTQAYRPRTIDAAALTAGTVPPKTLRH
jgi:hypothetical protein